MSSMDEYGTTIIFYDHNTNLFTDEDGVEYNISNLMSIEEIMVFKRLGGNYLATGEDGEMLWINFRTPELDRRLIYYAIVNYFTDEDDEPIFNPFSIITPNDLFLFKHNKKDVNIDGINGGKVNLIYFEGMEY